MFSDWGVLIRHIKQAAESAGSAVRVDMSEQEAAEVFRVGMSNLHLTATSKKRRAAELSVTTVLRLLREAQQCREQTTSTLATKRQRLA